MEFTQEMMNTLVDVLFDRFQKEVYDPLLARIEALEAGGTTASPAKSAQHKRNLDTAQRILQRSSREDKVRAIKIKHAVEAENAKSAARRAAKGQSLPVVRFA
jgi:hypothetical protein